MTAISSTKSPSVAGRIRRLPDGLVNQIAAGEVIENPAAALKELVENALDAGATTIHVTLANGGRSLLQVDDDGHGMQAADLQLAIERHATSKLPDSDLTHIATLGFRGEALPSIASVSRLAIATRHADDDHGWEIMVQGGAASPIAPTARSRGTRVTVRDLFYATPARLKFLKSERTETAKARDIIERLALAWPHVHFIWQNDDAAPVHYPAITGDLFDALRPRIQSILGPDFMTSAIPIQTARENMQLAAYVGLPTYHRPNANDIYIYVNNRPIKDRSLTSAIKVAYRDVMPGNRYPAALLFLTLPMTDIDVNVHPAKTEVRFKDAGLVRSFLISTITQHIAGSTQGTATPLRASLIQSFQNFAGRLQSRPQHSSGAVSHGMAERAMNAYQPLLPQSSMPSAKTEAMAETATTLPYHYPLGAARTQIHENYIIAQTENGMVVVDQHAAHERLVYEKMKAERDAGGVTRQALLLPVVVDLSARDYAALSAAEQDAAAIGLVYESFGVNAVLVREVPAFLGKADITPIIKDLAAQLAEQPASEIMHDRIDKLCATLACYRSVRSGRILNADEMNALLRQIEQTPNAAQCNHGRPTYITLSLNDIEKLFGRR